jgi:PAS domain-containing protein
VVAERMEIEQQLSVLRAHVMLLDARLGVPGADRASLVPSLVEDLRLALELLDAAEARLAAAGLLAGDDVADTRMHRLLDAAAEGIHQTTASGRLVAANESAARLLGYTNANELTAMVPDISALCIAPAHEEVLDGLRAGAGNHCYQAELRHQAGDAVPVSCIARSLSDAHGELLAVDVLWRPLNTAAAGGRPAQ